MWFFRSKQKQKQEASKESAAVRALNKQIAIQERTIKFLDEQLDQYMKIAEESAGEDLQHEILDLVKDFILNSQKKKKGNNNLDSFIYHSSEPDQPLRLESGLNFSDDKLKKILMKIPKRILKREIKKSDTDLRKEFQLFTGEEISDETIKRARELAQELI